MRYEEQDNELTELCSLTPPGLFLTDVGDLLWIIPGIAGPVAIGLNSINYGPMTYFDSDEAVVPQGRWLGPVELRLGFEARGDFDGVSGLVHRNGPEFYLIAIDETGCAEALRLVEHERRVLSQIGMDGSSQVFSHWSLVKLDQYGGETVFVSPVEPIRFASRHRPHFDPLPLAYRSESEHVETRVLSGT